MKILLLNPFTGGISGTDFIILDELDPIVGYLVGSVDWGNGAIGCGMVHQDRILDQIDIGCGVRARHVPGLVDKTQIVGGRVHRNCEIIMTSLYF